jgi:hypothetical protein
MKGIVAIWKVMAKGLERSKLSNTKGQERQALIWNLRFTDKVRHMYGLHTRLECNKMVDGPNKSKRE